MKDYKELIAKLRSTKSQSKRKMLDDAADAIECLQRQIAHKEEVRQAQAMAIMKLRMEREAAVAALKRLDVECKFCAHSKRPAACSETDILCDACELDCACKGCRENSKWEWRAD